MSPPARFFGKYRGVVTDNADPKGLGRLKVTVPSLLLDTATWAMPCSPFAGPGVGFFVMPPEKARIWVEFEAGRLERPIWSGGFWDVESPPPEPVMLDTPVDPTVKIFKSSSVNLKIDDKEGGGMSLTIGPPAVEKPITITGDGSGYKITVGEATLTLSETVELSLGDVKLTLSSSALLSAGGASLTLSSDGANLTTSSSVTVTGSSVSVNDGALQVS